jgi:hypothetical protein
LDEGRFAQARRALRSLEASGRLSETDVRQVWKHLGIVAVALGESRAEFYFKKLLSVEPGHKLRKGTSPKIVRTFERARSVVALTGGVSLRAEPEDGGVRLVVRDDPMDLIASVRVSLSGKKMGEVTPGQRLALNASGEVVLRLEGLDRFGNRVLGRRQVVDLVAQQSQLVAATARPQAERSLFTRWWVWSAVGAASAGVGTYFGFRARSKASDIEYYNITSASREARDVTQLVEDQHRSAMIANGAFVASALIGVGALYFAMRDDARDEEPAQRFGVSLAGKSVALTAAMEF